MPTVDISLKHHGAAASSIAQAVVWVPSREPGTTSSDLVYASHAMLSIATSVPVKLANGTEDITWKINTTLRTTLGEGQGSLTITSLAYAENAERSCLVSGYSDGSLTMWIREGDSSWNEHALVVHSTDEASLSITTVSCIWSTDDRLVVVTGSSEGGMLHTCNLQNGVCLVESSKTLMSSAVKSVYLHLYDHLGVLILIGTASPRHNRIHIYFCGIDSTSLVQYAGGLTGHEDWITCMDWGPSDMLATGSQDGRIRLWRFTTAIQENLMTDLPDTAPGLMKPEEDDDNSGTETDEDKQAAEEEEEGEARMEIFHGKRATRVTLEALLLGHEEMVTGVSWHPSPKTIYDEDLVLISSSMDRSILLWTSALDDGIWTPLTRVGSAGGILGGSVGSSLLGYLSASFDPSTGKILVGHAYGGSIHTWHLDDTNLQENMHNEPGNLSTEDRAAMVHWRAKSGITGHFDSVTDLSWESGWGSYLLSVGRDQTCRLWACVDTVWLELGRPQVHGYDLSSVVSLSTPAHPHLLVTGADEKEIRAFDAPRATIRLLEQTSGIKPVSTDSVDRVERAYIPSLGLSNKSTAVDAAEEERPNEEASSIPTIGSGCTLPMERDLGAVSLWPEIVKLFGHNTELYCLASTLAARTYRGFDDEGPSDVLVSSACKARDVDSASIRLWNVHKGTCHQVLSGGHKATVATMAFSPCGNYLASSGKDRRLCLWKKDTSTKKFELAWAEESAHKRIIWSVHFCPWNPACLVSGSRDGCIKVWQIVEDPAQSKTIARVLHSFAPVFSINGKPDAVTAVSIRPRPLEDGIALLALGLESGRLEFWSIPILESLNSKPSIVLSVPLSMCHKAACTKLAWKPQHHDTEGPNFLASSSMDHGIRIFEVR